MFIPFRRDSFGSKANLWGYYLHLNLFKARPFFFTAIPICLRWSITEEGRLRSKKEVKRVALKIAKLLRALLEILVEKGFVLFPMEGLEGRAYLDIENRLVIYDQTDLGDNGDNLDGWAKLAHEVAHLALGHDPHQIFVRELPLKELEAWEWVYKLFVKLGLPTDLDEWLKNVDSHKAFVNEAYTCRCGCGKKEVVEVNPHSFVCTKCESIWYYNKRLERVYLA